MELWLLQHKMWCKWKLVQWESASAHFLLGSHCLLLLHAGKSVNLWWSSLLYSKICHQKGIIKKTWVWHKTKRRKWRVRQRALPWITKIITVKGMKKPKAHRRIQSNSILKLLKMTHGQRQMSSFNIWLIPSFFFEWHVASNCPSAWLPSWFITSYWIVVIPYLQLTWFRKGM